MNQAIFEKLYIYDDTIRHATFNPPFDDLLTIRANWTTHQGDTVEEGRNVETPVHNSLDGGSSKRVMVEVLHRYSNVPYLLTQLHRSQKASSARVSRQRDTVSPPRQRRRLPKSVHPEITTAYEAGATTRQLATHYGVSKNNIEDILHRAGTKMRKHPLTSEQIDEARSLYGQGLSTYKIAEKFGVVQSTVWRALR